VIGSVFVGEPQPFPADIEAAEHSTVAVLSVATVKTLMLKEPRVALSVMQWQSGVISQLSEAVKTISSDVRSRVCRYIRDLAPDDASDLGEHLSVDLLVSRVELAAQLGTTPETLSRTFASLVEDGVLAADGREVEILDLGRLRCLADT
jgi:CRP/FNR family transcriptional regulator